MNEAAEVFDIEEFREGFRLLAEMTGESDPKPRRRRVVRRRPKLAEVVDMQAWKAKRGRAR